MGVVVVVSIIVLVGDGLFFNAVVVPVFFVLWVVYRGVVVLC